MKVAGFGFRDGATAHSLLSALHAAGGPAGVTMLATADDKTSAPGLCAVSRQMGLPVRGIAPAALQAAPVRTRSARSLAQRGTGSVAEASALAAAGPGARLIAVRAISDDRMATCAIAQGETT